MADALFIRLGEHGASWATFAPTGQITSGLSRGPLSGARAAADGRRVVVLVPGIDVLSTQAELPASSHARMRQIVPFSLEDSLADDIDGLMFAVGARIGATAAAVAVVSKASLEGWLAELSAAGIVPQAVYSETDGVPDVPATVILLLEGERVYARRPGQPPFVLEGVPLRQVVDLLRVGGADELKHAIAYADPQTRAHRQDEIRGLADDFETAEAKVAVDGLFPHFAATLAQRPATNLLQGPVRPEVELVGARCAVAQRGRVARRRRAARDHAARRRILEPAPRGHRPRQPARYDLPAARRHESHERVRCRDPETPACRRQERRDVPHDARGDRRDARPRVANRCADAIATRSPTCS